MKMKKFFKWAGIVVGAIALGIFGYYQLTPHENEELKEAELQVKSKGSKALTVNAVIIKPHLLTEELHLIGNLVPDEEVDLTFESSGKITDIFFKEGSHVNKGDLLAKVNDQQLQAQLKRLEAQLPLAEDRVYRQSMLLQRDAVSKEALEIVKTDLETLKADIERVKAEINMTELRAPFSGVIGLRKVSPGSYATPNTAVARLTRTSPIKIEFGVPERYANEIKQGTNLEFKVDGILETFPAQVYATESKLDDELHKLIVRAKNDNRDGKLLPGRYASIRLKQKEIADAIAVPSEAIVPEMGINKVYVYRAGKAIPAEIITGLRTDAEIQVLQGLQPGDTIITSGTLQLRNGMSVIIENIK